jgi:Tol biopolymer transport system component
MPLAAGARFGPYEIVAPIGAGGMGEVYRARDTRLNRDVAIKVLPDLFAADPDRLARFEREAQMLASLNHTNIAHVYGVEDLPPDHLRQGYGDQEGGSHATALIMELVEGEDLAQRLARGPIPFDEALQIATQIADALEAAHEHAIVHRDLKPANIKVRSDGVVKVLDFGLAKALEPAGTAADAVNSPTLTARGTQHGVILGTAAYMAPEQARGKPVDKRADIWAFGCVLYEMLTGSRPFVGEDVTDTLAAIVRADPDWSALPAETPTVIRTLLRRSLEKDRRERLPDIGAARLELKDARLRPQVEPRRAPAGPRPAALVAWAAAAAVLGAAMAGFAVWRVAGGDGRPATAEFMVLPPEPQSRLSAIAVSPDGRALAFLAERQSRRTLWIRELDAVAPRPVAGGDGAIYPFWSPDGRWLAFFAQGKLQKVASAGGPVHTICDAPSARGGTWGPGDIILFAPTPSAAIHRVSAAGGTPTPVTTFDAGRGERSHRFPSFLPDGRHFFFNSGIAIGVGLEVQVGSLDGGPPVRLFPGSNPSFADGYLLYVIAGTLMAQPFDAAARRVTGEPRPLARGLAIEPSGGAIVSANAATLAHRAADPKSTLAWFDRGGARLESVASELDARWFNLSPNDDHLAISARRAGGTGSNIWVIDLARRAATLLTAESADYGDVSWSSDGAEVVYAARSLTAGAPLGFFAKDAGGARPPRALVPVAPPRTLDSRAQLSPDGRLVVFVRSDEQNRTNIWALETSGDAKPIPIASVAFQPELSPDGRWLAYSSGTTGQTEVMIQDFPAATRRVQLSTAGGSGPRWRGDMKELFYVALNGAIMSVQLEGGSALTPRAPVELFTTRIRGSGSGLTALLRTFTVTRDGQRFLIPTPETDLPDTYLVTLNWRARLSTP